ncbi:MAG: hypothetical protein PUC12_11195 [Clostridiales bacterium]|nr:hypothetical protein [Clostridiales bacterium]
MSTKEAVQKIIYENIFVVVSTVPVALLLGTIVSFVFYIVIRYVIGIEGITWIDSGYGYILTVILYGIISLLSIACNVIIYIKENLIFKLKPIVLEQDGMFVHFIKNKFPKLWNHLLPKLVFIRLHKRMWVVRYGIESILICGMMVLIGICVSLYPALKKDAHMYSPYDMLYTEIYGVNQVTQDDIARIIKENNVELTEYKKFEFV